MNHENESKSRVWDEDLLERAEEFHGHGGPFMIIGLRMGLFALRLLDSRGWFGLKCKVYLRWSPPDSCVIDGLQSSTGCTMGKRNIEAVESEGVASEFFSGNRSLKITLRGDVLDEIYARTSGELGDIDEGLVSKLVMMSEDQLFTTSLK